MRAHMPTRSEIVALLLAAALPATSALGATVTLGSFQEQYWIYRNGTVAESDSSGALTVPGDLGIDYSTSDGAQIVGRALTSAAPAADVLVEAAYPGRSSASSPYYRVQAQSEVKYYHRIDYVGTGSAPVTSIPLAINYALAAAYTIDRGDFSIMQLNAYFEGPGRSDSALIYFSSGTNNAPRSDSVEKTPTYTYQLSSANWGQDLSFRVRASVDVVGYFSGVRPAASGQFQVVADPQVAFAPGFAYADQFTISLSPNITLIPEPTSAWLFSAGIAMLGALGRRRAKAVYAASPPALARTVGTCFLP